MTDIPLTNADHCVRVATPMAAYLNHFDWFFDHQGTVVTVVDPGLPGLRPQVVPMLQMVIDLMWMKGQPMPLDDRGPYRGASPETLIRRMKCVGRGPYGTA